MARMLPDGRRLGAHLPLGEGMVKAADRAAEIGANALQIFGDNPTAWKRRTEPAAEQAAFRARLAERGIAVGAGVSDSTADIVAPGTDTLFVVTSPPLRDILRLFLKPSQNQIGEILLHTLGLERTGVGSADLRPARGRDGGWHWHPR